MKWRMVAAAGWMLSLLACDHDQVFLDVWEPVGSPSTSRNFHTATELSNGEVLVVGGSSPGDAPAVSETEIFDSDLATFRSGPSLATGRFGHEALRLLDGRVLIFGGSRAFDSSTNSVEIYDPISEVFQTAASRTSLTTLGLALLGNGDVLAGGDGLERYEVERDVWSVIVPAGEGWAVFARLPDERILVSRSGVFLLLAPTLDREEAVAPPPTTPPLPPAEVLPDGRVLFVNVIYDPKSDTWTDVRPVFRGATMSQLPSGRFLIAGGRCGNPDALCAQAGADIYDSRADETQPATPMAHARFGHSATRLSSGAVLVIGGAGDDDSATTAELYRE